MEKRRILVIDDDPEIWQVYKDILAPEIQADSAGQQLARVLAADQAEPASKNPKPDFELRFAPQGQDGVDIAKAFFDTRTPFAVAFIDIRMPPGLDGVETAIRIRALDPDIELVIITAYSDRSREEIVEAVGCPDKLLFLRKPFDPEELAQIALSLTTKWLLARENKKKELELRNSEERFRVLVESSRDWVWEVDREGRFTFCSPACENIYGYRPDELIGRFLLDILTCPADRAGFENLLRQGIAGHSGFHGLEREGLRKDGKIAYIETSGVPIRDENGQVLGFRGIERDVSLRKKAEEALLKAHQRLENRVRERTADLVKANENLRQEIEERKAAEERLKRTYDEFYQIFDTASDGIRVIDKEFNILRVNDAFAALTGMEKESLVGQKCFEVFRGAECHTAQCPLTQIIHGTGRVEYEVERQRQDGTVIPCLATAYPFRGVDGGLAGIVTAIKDTTKWKAAERTLRAFAADLERSNQDLQNFAHTVSHDLQEPLLLIKAFSERLLSKFGGVLPDQGREYLSRIEQSAMRMQELINGLLMYSRLSTEAVSFKKVDLREVVRNVVADLEMRIRNSGGRVSIGDLCTIEADPVQMHQLFQNLVGNALKYQQHGVAPRVEVCCREEGGSHEVPVCTISVKDNGIGFGEDDIEFIFDIFSRLHGGREYEGTGVGLAICKRIVENHGGSIAATSTPGKGSEFIVRLPVRQGQDAVAGKDALSFGCHGRKRS